MRANLYPGGVLDMLTEPQTPAALPLKPMCSALWMKSASCTACHKPCPVWAFFFCGCFSLFYKETKRKPITLELPSPPLTKTHNERQPAGPLSFCSSGRSQKAPRPSLARLRICDFLGGRKGGQEETNHFGVPVEPNLHLAVAFSGNPSFPVGFLQKQQTHNNEVPSKDDRLI